jgi:hypothetical protein
VYVRQESNLHAQPRAPESESGTSPKFRHGRSTPRSNPRGFYEPARHYNVRSAGLEPACPYRAPGFEPGASTFFRHERGCHHCVVLKVPAGQCCWPASPRCTRTCRVQCCKHGATCNGECRVDISVKSAALQRNWVQQATGMSGDVPGRENSEAESFMRVFFGPLLPTWAHAHCWGGRLAE